MTRFNNAIFEAALTLEIEKRTRDLFKSIGKKGEKYDEIITRLLTEHEERGNKA